MPLSFFHNKFLAAFIIIISSFELHFVPILVLHPYEPLLSPSTKADSVIFSAKQRRMSKKSDNYKNTKNNVKWKGAQKNLDIIGKSLFKFSLAILRKGAIMVSKLHLNRLCSVIKPIISASIKRRKNMQIQNSFCCFHIKINDTTNLSNNEIHY